MSLDRVRVCGNVYLVQDILKFKNKRWYASRKEVVLKAIDAGILTEETVLREFSMTQNELDDWKRNYNKGGRGALLHKNVKNDGENYAQ
jgi:Protein of unknown function (DUF1153)